MPETVPPLEVRPRRRMYIGPQTDEVDEFGVPLVGGAPIANDTVVANGVASPMETQQVPQIPFGMRQQMIAADMLARKQKYDNEVASADMLRQQQREQAFLEAGLQPPQIKPVVPTKPEFLKSGEDWYQIGQTGIPELLIRGKALDKFAPPASLEAAKRFGEPPEGFVWALGPSGFTMERKPSRGIEDLFADMSKPKPAPASGGIRSFNSEAEARAAGVKPGEKIRIIGVGVGELE